MQYKYYNTLQYSTVQYSTVQYSTIQYNAVQFIETSNKRTYQKYICKCYSSF